MALTDTVGWGSTPGQVGKAGPGGGALKQVTFLTTEEHRASNLRPEHKAPMSSSNWQCFIGNQSLTSQERTPTQAVACVCIMKLLWLSFIGPLGQLQVCLVVR